MAKSYFKWCETNIEGCYKVTPFSHTDARGAFVKPYTVTDFASTYLHVEKFPVNFSCAEIYYSYSKKGVIRGLHIQGNTAKLVTCQRGLIQDVIVDLRPNSPTYKMWVDVFLRNNESVFVPAGCAHGFKTACSSTVLYVCDEIYQPLADTGIRYDDPDIGVKWAWGNIEAYVGKRDRELPSFQEWREKHEHNRLCV